MVTEARLRCYVSDESIYLYYFGDFELNKKYNSPLRRDPKPSFLIREHMGRLYWKDFGLGRDSRPDAIGFVMELHRETREQAVRRIWSDFLKQESKVVRKKRSLNIGLPYDLMTRDMNPAELAYWQQHCVEDWLLRKFNVRAVASLCRHGSVVWKSTDVEPAYAYMFGDNVFKIYRPKSQDRFRGQDNGLIIEGYAQLPATGPRLIITSSMKDAMVLTAAGHPACAPPGESNIRAVLEKARELNARFAEVLILFDNDGPGLLAADRLAKHTNWRKVFVPKEIAKDPADVVKKYGNRFVLSRILDTFAR